MPVDGFWSIIVYNAKGYLQKNPYDAYSLNSITAQKSADGSVAIQFGGCDGKIPNCLPTMQGCYSPQCKLILTSRLLISIYMNKEEQFT